MQRSDFAITFEASERHPPDERRYGRQGTPRGAQLRYNALE
jgi:hypothetical protein